MSSPSNTTFTSSTFDTLFNAALEKYTKQTGKDLCNHPLASEIDSCKNIDSILNIFKKQAQAFDEFKNGDVNLLRWLTPVVDVLHALSTNKAIRDSVSHVSPATTLLFHILELSIPQVFPLANAVFCGIGILLSVSSSLLISTSYFVTFGATRKRNM